MFFDENLLNSSSGWRSGQIQHLSLFQIWWQGQQQQPKNRITIFSQDLNWLKVQWFIVNVNTI